LKNIPTKSKSLFENVSWNVIFNIWTAVITFFITPFLIHKLGVEHYGLYILVTTISGFMGLMSFGLGEATLRYVAFYAGRDDLDGINRVIGATFSIYAIVIIIACPAVAGFAPFFVSFLDISNTDIAVGVNLLRLTTLIFALTIINNALSSIPQALLRYDVTTKILFLQSFLQTIGIVIILKSGLGLYPLLLLIIGLLICKAIIQAFAAKKIIPGLTLMIHPSKKGIKEVFSYGIFNFITYTFHMIQGYSDRLILGMYLNVSAISFLSAPQNLADRASGLIYQVGAVLVPKFSSIQNSKEMKLLFFRSSWLLITLTISIFGPMAILFPDFLKLWIDKSFADQSAYIGQLIAFSFINYGATLSASNIYRGMAKPQVISYYSIAVGLFILVGNLALIPRYGLAGAGYSMLFKTFGGIILTLFAFKLIESHSFWRSSFHYAIFPLVICLIIIVIGFAVKSHISIHNWLSFFASGILFALFHLSAILTLEWVCYRNNSMTLYLFSLIRTKYLS
jgi:O-antigen/teichoic acid export membrane protein